ncbi:hypothetical protein LIA77_02099 [Sarocladium implicatum]|nr:hypothetical protein LIA77_02099 [Sarocladium implicatum]
MLCDHSMIPCLRWVARCQMSDVRKFAQLNQSVYCPADGSNLPHLIVPFRCSPDLISISLRPLVPDGPSVPSMPYRVSQGLLQYHLLEAPAVIGKGKMASRPPPPPLNNEQHNRRRQEHVAQLLAFP